jgi:spore germination protein YaaH
MRIRKNLVIIISLIMVLFFNSQVVLAAKANSSVPTGLTTSNISTSSITLNWSSVSGASGYYVYMATPNDTNYTKIATVTGTSLIKSDLTANTSYWFYVVAYNRYGLSPNSIHMSATTLQIITTVGKKQVLGFTTYYYSGDTSSYNSMVANTSTIDEIATQNYNTDSLGNIFELVPTNQITYANSNGIKSYAMLQNNFDGNIAKSVL